VIVTIRDSIDLLTGGGADLLTGAAEDLAGAVVGLTRAAEGLAGAEAFFAKGRISDLSMWVK
jgi:hypothetical protein